jgi:hypothetical protein
MHFWPEMVLGVIAVEKEKPVVDFSVALTLQAIGLSGFAP